jgi:ABC-type ATPase involved in cell division
VIRLIAVTLRLEAASILDAVTAHANAGELVLIEGSRAAGKTKLLEIAGARRRPTSGQVWIGDREVTAVQRDYLPFVRRNIGFLSAAPKFLSGLSVLENLMLPLAARAEPVESAREAALRALGRLGMVSLGTLDPEVLSASARRLVGVARALAGSPPVVLLDDPGSSLAPADMGALLSALLGAVENGAAVVCTSGDGGFTTAAVRAGARRLHLDSGRVLSSPAPIGVLSGGRAAMRLARNEAAP